MRRKVGCIVLALIAVGVIVTVIIVQTKGGDNPFKKERMAEEPLFEAVRRGELKLTVEATGNTEPITDIDVKSEATGRIVEFYVEEGDTVSEGDLICKLDQSNQLLTVQQRELNARAAKLRYDEAKQGTAVTTRSGLETQVDSALSNLEAAREAAENAEAYYRRIKSLHERGFAFDQELENAYQQMISSQSTLESAELAAANAETSLESFDTQSEDNSIEQARLAWESAKVALSEARKLLGDSVISSPIDGIILQKPVDVGDSVVSINSSFSQGTTIVTVADLKRIQVRTSVDEIDIGKLEIGQQATITVDTYFDEEFAGVVTNIYPQGVTTGSGLVSFIAIIEVDNEEDKLLGNMTAAVSIEAQVIDDALLIPLGATRAGEEPDSTIVYVLKEGEDEYNTKAESEEVEIKTGDTDYYDIVVLEGLEEGDMIKVRGFETNIQFGG